MSVTVCEFSDIGISTLFKEIVPVSSVIEEMVLGVLGFGPTTNCPFTVTQFDAPN